MPRVTQKGQVTIPYPIRSMLTIKSGDEVVFEIDEEKVVLKKKRGAIENLKNYVGFLSHLKGKTSDDIIDELRGKANDFRYWYQYPFRHLIPNTLYVESSLNFLISKGANNTLIISDIVFAELGSQFHSFQDLNIFLQSTSITLVPSNENSLFEAITAWREYSHRKKDIIICPACGSNQKFTCGSCNKIIPHRQHILSDFLIGSHAKILADKLITRDRGFYRTYFYDIDILTP